MTREILLTKDKVAIVDDDDFDMLSKLKWTALDGKPVWYATHYYRDGKKVHAVSMHRFILGVSDPSIIVDHINGDGLDNTRKNLRVVTVAQNNANRNKWARKKTSMYKGVFPWRNLWMVKIGKTKIKPFYTEEDAALAYDNEAVALWGEFARTNFPKPLDKKENA